MHATTAFVAQNEFEVKTLVLNVLTTFDPR